MVQPIESIPFDELVSREAGQLPWVSTLVAITAVPTPELISTLESFHRTGRPVSVIIIGNEEPKFNMDGLVYYHVPADIAWEKVEKVGVNPAN
jgi:hypothetical protein